MNLTKVKRVRASDAVLQILRESILDRTFQPGDRLDVRLLSDKLDVSPTPIKDALTRLVAEGLIEVRPRSGTYVTRLSAKDILDTLNVRRSLECLAAETIFDHMSEGDLASLRKLAEFLERPVSSERERQRHDRVNNQFHQQIVELSGNRKLLELYSNLNAHVKMARVHNARVLSAERMREERSEHRRIMQALSARDRSGLREALDVHIARAAAVLVKDIEAEAS